jgi:hypothetical protein
VSTPNIAFDISLIFISIECREMALILEIFLSVLLIGILILWFRQKNKNKDFYKNIPGPPPLPIFGNILEIGSTTSKLQFIRIHTQMIPTHPKDKLNNSLSYKKRELNN